MIERSCPLCQSNSITTLFKKDETDFWRCEDCQFRFATPAENPNLPHSLDAYEDAYLQYLAPDAGDTANFDALSRWMERHTPVTGKRVLDVGAGSGKLVRYLRAHGVDAVGIEPARALFDRFLSGDATFACTTLDDVHAFHSRPFDIVTAFDVVEHVDDPRRFFGAVSRALTPDGLFFASTPNVESLPARLLGRRWHFYHSYHLSYFSPRTFAQATAAHGLRVMEWSHRGRLRSAGYILRYGMEFVARAKAPRWAHLVDRWYVPVNLFDTMYIVCRRDASATAPAGPVADRVGPRGAPE